MDKKATARVEACSGGVFAVAITLLILEITVPASLRRMANRDLIQAAIQPKVPPNSTQESQRQGRKAGSGRRPCPPLQCGCFPVWLSECRQA